MRMGKAPRLRGCAAALICASALAAITALSGCTTVTPTPTPTTPAESTPVAPPPVTPTTTPVPEVDPAEFICEPATPAIAAAVDGLGAAFAPVGSWHRTANDFAVVQVGEGNRPGEQWAIVVGSRSRRTDNSADRFYFLTNFLSTQRAPTAIWIPMGDPAFDPSVNWRNVDWPPERLAAGQAAQLKAATCFAQLTPDPVIDPSALGECEPATAPVINWLSLAFGPPEPPEPGAVPLIPDGNVRVVKVGPGRDPGVDWWLVAYRQVETEHLITALTNAPGVRTRGTFIVIGEHAGDASGWQRVDWPVESIEMGQLAAAKAIACLGG